MAEYVKESRELLGSRFSIKLPESSTAFFSVCFEEVQRIQDTYSRFLETSELSLLNNRLGFWQNVSKEFFYLIRKGLEFNVATNGAFDITVKKALDNLGYDKEYSFKTKKPSFFSGFFSSFLNPISLKEKQVFLRKEIDFGGLGKGFALDQVAAILDSHGVSSYYLDAGGDIFVKGSWDVLLEHPDDVSRTLGKVVLKDCALAGSSSNRRRWKGGHHLINSVSGQPENSVKAIFVKAECGIDADAYATGLFTMGFSKAVSFSKDLAVEVLLISSKDEVFVSDGFDVELF